MQTGRWWWTTCWLEGAIRLNSDFDDLLSALSKERVRYLVVGAYAVMHHTEPRYTKDLDIWVDPTPANAERVLKALKRFGAPLKHTRASDFTNRGLVYQAGVEPVRFNVLSPRHLIANKRRVGRPQDLLDVERLKPLLRRKR